MAKHSPNTSVTFADENKNKRTKKKKERQKVRKTIDSDVFEQTNKQIFFLDINSELYP